MNLFSSNKTGIIIIVVTVIIAAAFAIYKYGFIDIKESLTPLPIHSND